MEVKSEWDRILGKVFPKHSLNPLKGGSVESTYQPVQIPINNLHKCGAECQVGGSGWVFEVPSNT